MKREGGEYHVHHAARLDRLNARLLSGNSNKETIGKEGEQEEEVEEEVLAEGEEKMEGGESFVLDPWEGSGEVELEEGGRRRRLGLEEAQGWKSSRTAIFG